MTFSQKEFILAAGGKKMRNEETVGWVLNCIDGRPGRASKEHILLSGATTTLCGKKIPTDAFDIGDGVGNGRCGRCLIASRAAD